MVTANKTIDNLLNYLFADKKAVYIDDITISNTGNYEVSWCMDFTLRQNTPQWRDTTLTRRQLLSYIKNEQLNHWEAFRYDDVTGAVQPFINITHDLETFLDENYREVIKEFIGSSVH